jgi:phosphonopyruvate decarboxylase
VSLQASFLEALRIGGRSIISGVPGSSLGPLIDEAEADPGTVYVPATNEGDAVAVAAGAWLGGLNGVALFQNSGLGNAFNPLTSLCHTFGIPVLLVCEHRGAPGAPLDEPQHRLMGAITEPLLEKAEIEVWPFPETDDGVHQGVAEALKLMSAERRSSCFVLPRKLLGKSGGPPAPRETPAPQPPSPDRIPSDPVGKRGDVLRAVRESIDPEDVMIASTGFTGRELYALSDEPNQFYMVGSMGCASSLGLGVALAQPHRRVVVLDGDGALLMRMGNLAMVGMGMAPNLVHLLIDNGQHESTGGQRTTTNTAFLAGAAAACGYPQVLCPPDLSSIDEVFSSGRPGPTFLHLRVDPGKPSDLPRPTVTPREVSDRFRDFLTRGG